MNTIVGALRIAAAVRADLNVGGLQLGDRRVGAWRARKLTKIGQMIVTGLLHTILAFA